MNINNGDIIIVNRKQGGWFSSIQRFITRRNFTHTAICIGLVRNELSLLSADELINTLPVVNYYKEKEIEIYVYNFKNIKPQIINQAIDELYKEFAGTQYGYSQLVWFVYRWIKENIFKKDVRKEKRTWLIKGNICSELVFKYLDKLSLFNIELKNTLDKYYVENVHVGDMYDICNSLPNIIELKEYVYLKN